MNFFGKNNEFWNFIFLLVILLLSSSTHPHHLHSPCGFCRRRCCSCRLFLLLQHHSPPSTLLFPNIVVVVVVRCCHNFSAAAAVAASIVGMLMLPLWWHWHMLLLLLLLMLMFVVLGSHYVMELRLGTIAFPEHTQHFLREQFLTNKKSKRKCKNDTKQQLSFSFIHSLLVVPHITLLFALIIRNSIVPSAPMILSQNSRNKCCSSWGAWTNLGKEQAKNILFSWLNRCILEFFFQISNLKKN